MTVFMGNPNAAPPAKLHGKKKAAPEKAAPPASEVEGEGPGWRDVEPPKKREVKVKPETPASVVKAKEERKAARAKAKPAEDQPTEENPKAKAKAAPKAAPNAKAKASNPKTKAAPKAKAVKPEPVAKEEKPKAPRRSKGRRPPPAPVEGKVTKILLRLTARDVIDVDLHRGELTRPGYIHHLMRVGIASKGRRATDPS